MATATLELINPYAKYGLKRRPTYDEIIGLIGENETLTGQLPDRTATQFKASQEGSFFDGLDHLEILKEQQNRIHERQMRELLMRQNIGGGTYSIVKLQDQRRGGQAPPPDPEVETDSALQSTTIQTELQERANQAVSRQQQTGDAHRTFLERASSLPIIGGLLSSPARTPARTPQGSTLGSTIEQFGQEAEPEEEMLTARGGSDDRILDNLFHSNINATEEQLQQAYAVLRKYKDISPEIMASNFYSLNEIYNVLRKNGYITNAVSDKYYEKASQISDERNRTKQRALRDELVKMYVKDVYDKFINTARSSGGWFINIKNLFNINKWFW